MDQNQPDTLRTRLEERTDAARSSPTAEVVGPTRRSFLREAGKKTAYVAPIIMTLAGTQANAASGDFDSTCADAGSPCVIATDCCAGLTCLPAMTCGPSMG